MRACIRPEESGDMNENKQKGRDIILTAIIRIAKARLGEF